jgi:hypothetical protein
MPGQFFVMLPLWDFIRTIHGAHPVGVTFVFAEQGNCPKPSAMMPLHTLPNRRESIHGG